MYERQLAVVERMSPDERAAYDIETALLGRHALRDWRDEINIGNRGNNIGFSVCGRIVRVSRDRSAWPFPLCPACGLTG